MTLDQLLDNLKNGVLLTDDEEVNLTVGQLQQLVKEGMGEQPNLAELSRQFGIDPPATSAQELMESLPFICQHIARDVLNTTLPRQKPEKSSEMWIEPATGTLHLQPNLEELPPLDRVRLLQFIADHIMGSIEVATHAFQQQLAWEHSRRTRES